MELKTKRQLHDYQTDFWFIEKCSYTIQVNEKRVIQNKEIYNIIFSRCLNLNLNIKKKKKKKKNRTINHEISFY